MALLSFLLENMQNPRRHASSQLKSFLRECGARCLEDSNFNLITIIVTIVISVISRVSSAAMRISRTDTYQAPYVLSEWLGTLHTLTHLTSHNSPMNRF